MEGGKLDFYSAELKQLARLAECYVLINKASVYHVSWNYHVVMMSLVPDYSTTFYRTSHSDSYYYRD
jgi:hypothetical protein